MKTPRVFFRSNNSENAWLALEEGKIWPQLFHHVKHDVAAHDGAAVHRRHGPVRVAAPALAGQDGHPHKVDRRGVVGTGQRGEGRRETTAAVQVY
jgi:hypothetical protein